MEDTSKVVINNEYDYSNILPTLEAVTYLVKYCDNMNKQLTKLVEMDEEKNKQFKEEYKEYTYKHSFGQHLEIDIRNKSFNTITCNDYEQFVSASEGGNMKNVSSVDIKLCLNFRRGKGNNMEDYENIFVIKFRPYEITFARKSNHNDSNMSKIEDQINDILKKFPIANSIFCSK